VLLLHGQRRGLLVHQVALVKGAAAASALDQAAVLRGPVLQLSTAAVLMADEMVVRRQLPHLGHLRLTAPVAGPAGGGGLRLVQLIAGSGGFVAG